MYKFLFFSLLAIHSTYAVGATQEWKFEKTLEISSNKLILDGKEIKDFGCPKDATRENKAEVGIAKSKEFNFSVDCYENHMGGYFIKNSDFLIAQADGDEGDSWDKQSLVFSDSKSKKVLLARRTVLRRDHSVDCESIIPFDEKKYKECQKNAKVTCNTSVDLFEWNSKKKTFSPTSYSGRVPDRKIDPRINDSKCKSK